MSPLLGARGAQQDELFEEYVVRYLGNMQVYEWLLKRDPPEAVYPSSFTSNISYACLYHPPRSSGRRAPRAGVPRPALENGDLLLMEAYYDGIAVGRLHGRSEVHMLAEAREQIGKTNLSKKPVVRRFAADLRMNALEFIEFAWMDDGSLIIACRRLKQPKQGEGLCLMCDILFYDKVPHGELPGKLLRRMICKEKPLKCVFCKARGDDQCNCPPTFKQRAPTDKMVVLQRRRNFDLTPAEPTWENYVQRIFSTDQSGSFFVRWYKRNEHTGALDFFYALPRPIAYQFVVGSKDDTAALTSLYIKQLQLHHRTFKNDMLLSSSAWNVFRSAGMRGPLMLPWEGDEQRNVNNEQRGFGDQQLLDFLGQGASHHPAVPDSPLTSGRSSPDRDDNYVPDIEPEIPVVYSTEQMFTGSDPVTLSSADLSFMNAIEIIEEGCSETSSGDKICAAAGQYGDNSQPNEQNEKYDIAKSADGKPTCPECGAKFRKMGNVKRHIQTVHEKRRPFRCDVCKKTFGHKTHRDRHLKSHNRELPFSCPWCDRHYRLGPQLERHVRAVHSGPDGVTIRETEFRCQICGAAFAQKSNLTRHIASIHEKKRHACPYCEQTFGQPFDKKRHILKLHADKEVAPPVPRRMEAGAVL